MARLVLAHALAAVLFLGCATTSGGGGGDDAAVPDGGAASDAGGGDDDDDDSADAGVAVRSCATRVGFRPDGAVESVAVAGAWDWDARTPMLDPDGDGRFEVDLELATGIWSYKLVVTHPGGEVTWHLDPENPYRAYDGGIENSAARVEDCAAPLVELVSHEVGAGGAVARLRLTRGAGGSPIADDGVDVTVRHEAAETAAPAVVRDGDEVEVTLDGLAPGKYTIAVAVRDSDGVAARPLLVPFWIEAEPFDWRDALIYMVMTDRFRDADPANDPPPLAGAEAAADFHGGDLRGVTEAIEDGTFDDLGVRALWLSPFVENAAGVEYENGHGVSGYHGYWPVRAREIDPRLGSEADLDALVTAAHQRGIRVLMDYVINHVHEDHEYVAAHPDWFHVGCECGQPGCDWTEHRLDCSFHPYLPDVDWQHPEASEQMIADALWWLERFDLDGLRVDAVKHVEDLAIFNLSTRVHEAFEQGGTEYHLLGETAMGWNGDDLAANLSEYATIARYLGPFALGGQFDFVLHHATARSVFTDETRGMLHLDYWTRASLQQYPADAVMTPFVGSHDAARLVSLATYGSGDPLVGHKWASDGLPAAPTSALPYDRAALALTWMFTVPGAPLLYYGDEYGEHGGSDPDNRHDWVAPGGRSDWQDALYARVAAAGQLRRELAPLRRGDYQQLTVTEELLSFARTWQGEAVIVVLNRGAAATTATVTVPASILGDGPLEDRLGDGGALAITGGQVSVPLAARGAAVLVRP